MAEPTLILYGGTFDPPHLGHSDCIRHAQKRFPNAHMIILPSYDPPLDNDVRKVPGASFGHRVSMAKIAFEEFLVKGSCELSEIEQSLPKPNFSIETAGFLAAKNPGKSIAWMVGADQLHMLPRWKEPHGLLATASLLVIGRKQQTSLKLQVQSTLQKALNLSIAESKADSFECLSVAPVYYLDLPTIDVASSSIRKFVQNQEPIPKTWLCKGVKDYIRKNSLYLKGVTNELPAR